MIQRCQGMSENRGREHGRKSQQPYIHHMHSPEYRQKPFQQVAGEAKQPQWYTAVQKHIGSARVAVGAERRNILAGKEQGNEAAVHHAAGKEATEDKGTKKKRLCISHDPITLETIRSAASGAI